MTLRSILWLGSAEGLARSGLVGAGRFDIVWERDIASARRLDLGAFHAVVWETEAPTDAGPFPLPPGTRLVTLGKGQDLDPVARERLGGCGPSPPEPVHGLVAESDAMRQLLDHALRFARSRAPVLVTGETGTGKERIARVLHEASPRAAGPFVAINCAALPDTLLESELFGHRRGAFSGADRDRAGLVESAAGGTLFLDEIGELRAGAQASLLRVLQEHRVRRLGETEERAVDVRVVAATHRELRPETRPDFREDLYYRLAVLRLHVPPLRERPADVRALVRHRLIAELGADGARKAEPTLAAWARLEAHAWPGNVRELENEVLRALAFADSGRPLRREHFSPGLGDPRPPELSDRLLERSPAEPLRDTLDRVEAWAVRRALESHEGRRADAARQLGVTREGLYKKMKRLNIE